MRVLLLHSPWLSMLSCLVLHVPLIPQGYGEGSHYSEHEALSSPFISSGIAGRFLNPFLKL